MRIIRNNIIPFKGFSAINLLGILFVRKDAEIDEVTLNHEAIHTAQMRELGYVLFYLIYVVEYAVLYLHYLYKGEQFRDAILHYNGHDIPWREHISTRKAAYRAISFEREAYRHEKERDYLKKRKRYNEWRK